MKNLPTQAEHANPDADFTGMRDLWAEILTMGLKEASGFVTNDPRGSRLAESQAQNWMRSKDFIEVCDLAGVNPDCARKAQAAGRFTREAWVGMTKRKGK